MANSYVFKVFTSKSGAAEYLRGSSVNYLLQGRPKELYAKNLSYVKVEQEPMSRSMQLPYWAHVTAFLHIDTTLVVHHFFCERKALPVQWHSDVN